LNTLGSGLRLFGFLLCSSLLIGLLVATSMVGRFLSELAIAGGARVIVPLLLASGSLTALVAGVAFHAYYSLGGDEVRS